MKNACVLLILLLLPQTGCGVSKKYFGLDEPEDKQVEEEEELDPPHNAILTNLLFFPNALLADATSNHFMSFSVEYHRMLSDHIGIIVAPEVLHLYSMVAYDMYNYDFYTGLGGGLLLGVSGFFEGRGLSEWYGSACVGLGMIDGGGWYDSMSLSSNVISLLVEGGYMKTWSNNFSARFGLGLQTRFVYWHRESLGHVTVLSPHFRLDLGFAW